MRPCSTSSSWPLSWLCQYVRAPGSKAPPSDGQLLPVHRCGRASEARRSGGRRLRLCPTGPDSREDECAGEQWNKHGFVSSPSPHLQGPKPIRPECHAHRHVTPMLDGLAVARGAADALPPDYAMSARIYRRQPLDASIPERTQLARLAVSRLRPRRSAAQPVRPVTLAASQRREMPVAQASHHRGGYAARAWIGMARSVAMSAAPRWPRHAAVARGAAAAPDYATGRVRHAPKPRQR